MCTYGTFIIYNVPYHLFLWRTAYERRNNIVLFSNEGASTELSYSLLANSKAIRTFSGFTNADFKLLSSKCTASRIHSHRVFQFSHLPIYH